MVDDSRYWTPRRRELVQWFDDRAPSFSEGYRSAVQLLHAPRFPARVHLICHLVRDIYRHLPAALGEKSMPRPSEVFPNMVRALAERWENSPPRALSESKETASDIPVSPQVYKSVEKLVKKSMQLQHQPTIGHQLAIVLFRALDRGDDDFIHRWIIKSFDDEYDFFVRRAHLARSLKDVPTDDGLLEHFEAFERAFHSLIGPYFSGKEELDAILQDANAGAD